MDANQEEQVRTLYDNITKMFAHVDSRVVATTLAAVIAHGVTVGCLDLKAITLAVEMGAAHLKKHPPPKG